MPDYGHDLLFGTFITPTNHNPEAVIALTQLSERAGFDLATFQDHPYQPGFFDTWTLVSFLAAATEQIKLVPNVVNLPLRPPAVLARSVASLDILSGGRVELGLGAGAFWDAIVAMGGQRRTPGEAVDALTEAIEVIRAIWAADERSGVRVDGEHYRVVGAKRGPKPAHDVGIWLGAYKPRMLRLVGRLADGWLPSLGYLQPEQLGAGNAIIDAAAEEAGRSPRDIRRLVNVGIDLPAERLAELAIRDGVSAFIVGGDDPTGFERFGLEVAPAVRELVENERAGVRPEPEPEPDAVVVRDVSVGTSVADLVGVTPTPDSGIRLSDARRWDESARPSRPIADGVTYSDRGRAGAKHLIDVHDHLRRELSEVRDLVDQVRKGALDAAAARSAINEMTMRQNNWTLGAYCARYCALVTGHHSLEDSAVFPYLRSREKDLEPVIDRLVEEHVVIHDVLEDLDKALVEFVRGEDFTALQEALDVLTDTLLSHLAYEERELVEPLARYGFYPNQL